MLAGGGVDVRVWKRVSVRLFQLDWILWHGAGMTEKKNGRISSGIVIRNQLTCGSAKLRREQWKAITP